ncbi:hypothetical protein [Kitasatospora sp. NBC_00458]|uniref:hypothetical protein n=1 Tax=Kitasatospora sp. NBC_00458 TaxID=2903568 RepID=UPI002E18F237
MTATDRTRSATTRPVRRHDRVHLPGHAPGRWTAPNGHTERTGARTDTPVEQSRAAYQA